MDEKRRNLFADLVLQCKCLSKCRESKAAIVVGNSEQLISIGYNAPISEDYYQYPIMMALQHLFGEPLSVFLSYFPHVDELLLLVPTPIRTIYFWGEVNDEATVQFLNSYNETSQIPFEIINLKK
jgi:hypothetical protein